MQENKILNVNVGILGHVDSGKTSLARAISTLLSTAALDKSPASQERGITLDLGFSAHQVPIPEHLKHLPYETLQFTFVDCPGHASLIRTIIGGAQIIDMMILVIDITKGIQTQTAECIVIGEITCNNAVIVLNKIDQLPEPRAETLEKKRVALQKVIDKTAFKGSPMVPISANPSGGAPVGISDLVAILAQKVAQPQRSGEGPLLFEFDHCFPIKGQGTVLTGTVLKGSISVNQMIEFPAIKMEKKVKSMQMFHKPVNRAIQGDRVGVCVTQLDASLLERGLAATPGSVHTLDAAIVTVNRVRFFKGDIPTKSQFHVTVGHATVMASVEFFCKIGQMQQSEENASLPNIGSLKLNSEFNSGEDYEFMEALPPGAPQVFALLTFEKPIIAPLGSIVIASRLDIDIHSNSCRIAFFGNLLRQIDPTRAALFSQLRIFKIKTKTGSIERVHDPNTLIGKDLFKKETDMNLFVGMKIKKDNGEIGVIESSFGKSGKFKARFTNDQTGATGNLHLSIKRYIYDQSKKNYQ
eukprot:Phypoly_transcript_06527.p1 GENE.Phypoly_transcript_06527~~Phypoly_transcript_06527.p1  ORF type:complete len:526 (+),score=74.82 Phypoly_transcript_06527:151-1728(+)